MSTWEKRIETLEEPEKYHRGKYFSGSALDKFIDVFSTVEYAVGGYILRQRQLKEYVDTEREAGRKPSAREVYGRIAGSLTEGAAYGIKHRVSPSAVLEVEGFWAGMAVDVGTDPTSYISLGLTSVIKTGAKTVIPAIAAKVSKTAERYKRADEAIIRPSRQSTGSSQDAYEILENTLAAGIDINRVQKERIWQLWDEVLDEDVVTGIATRQQATREILTLRWMKEPGTLDRIEDADIIRLGMMGLKEKGFIKPKARGGGWMLMPAGTKQFKENEKALADVIKTGGFNPTELLGSLKEYTDIGIEGYGKIEKAEIKSREDYLQRFGVESYKRTFPGKPIPVIGAAAGTLALAGGAKASEDDDRVEAEVIRVIDGDTIKVDIDGEIHSVRYIGIDTPETTKGKNEPGGQEATEANRRLVAGKTVYLEKDKSDTGHYGRLLRNVFTEDGTFVNAELVRSGHAEVFTYGADRRYESVLKRAAVESTAGTLALAGGAKASEAEEKYEPGTLGIITRTALKLHVWQENIGKRLRPDEQATELSRLIQEEQESGSIGYEQRIKLLQRAKGRKFHGSDWGEEEFQAYLESTQAHGRESPESTAAYSTFIAAQGDLKHSLQAADPKHPELEDERGKIFTVLLYQESLSGTAIYNLRKKAGFGEIDWIEQTEADERVKEISPSQALGITTRETRIWTARGATGLAVDILLDPLTYESPVGTVGSIGGKVLKVVKAERRAIVSAEGAEVIMKQTRWIREKYPEVSATEAREAAESLVLDIAHKKDLYAARKYQEKSFSIFGHPLFYWSDVGRVTGAISEALPYTKKRQAIYQSGAGWIGETFEAFYKVGQAAGEHGKDIFKSTIRKLDYERDLWNERARALAAKGPKWWRRKERRDVNEQVLEYIQRGVEPTDPRVYDMAEYMIAEQKKIADADIAAGLLKPERLREGYVFRVYTPEFRKEVFEKKFGYRQGDDIAIYERQLESAHRRELHPDMSHKELNEWAMKKYGIKALVTDPAQILRMRGVQSSRARGMAELRRQVGEELGVPEAEVRQHLWREAQPKHPSISVETPEEVTKYLQEGQGVDVLGRLTPVTKETTLKAVQKRGVKGDDLLDVSDLIDDVRGYDPTIKIDKEGYITLYHRTSKEGAESITESGYMTTKEPGLYFGSKPEGQISGYGEAVVEVKVPIEDVRLNDIFIDEVHFNIPQVMPGTKYPVDVITPKSDTPSEMLEAFEHPIKLSRKIPSKLPDTVMMDGERRVKHEYTTLSGEKRVSYIHEDVAEEVSRKEVEGIKVLSATEKYMRWGYTVPHVAFHIRNIQGILEQNMYYRVSPESYSMSLDILYGDPEKIFDIPGYGKMPAKEIKEMYHQAGITGKLGYVEDPAKFAELPIGPMREIEDVGRSAVATEVLMKGGGRSIDEAAHVARLLHFEYGAAGLTPREQKYLRHLFLFYTWPKKNIEVTTKMLGQQPGVAGGATKFQQAWITPEEYEQLPEWAKESYVLTYNGEFYVLDVPYLAALQLMTGDGYAFSHTPALKFYIGAVFGRDPSSGRPLGWEDMPAWAAEAGVGRFISVGKEFGKVRAGEIPASRMVKHQVGGTYVGDLDTEWFEPARFEATRWHQPQPSKEQKYAAWMAAGSPEGYQIKILKSPPPRMAGVPAPPKPEWWEVWKKQPEEPPLPEFELAVLKHEAYAASQGFKLTPEQEQYVFNVTEGEPRGSREARYNQLVAEREAYKSGEMHLEQPTPEQERESWERAGLAIGEPYKHKIYRDDLGGLIGVSTYTPDELEEMGGWKPTEEVAKYAFRKGAKIAPKAELAKFEELEEETGFRPSKEQMEWATRGSDVGELLTVEQYAQEMERRAHASKGEDYQEYAERNFRPVRFDPDEQIAIWAQEYQSPEALEEAMREELHDLRANYAVKGELPLHRRAGGGDARRRRRQELEEMLGIGVDR